jgi:hypothetical protein
MIDEALSDPTPTLYIDSFTASLLQKRDEKRAVSLQEASPARNARRAGMKEQRRRRSIIKSS